MTDVARRLGLSTVLWSVDSQDWRQPGTRTSGATRAIARPPVAGLSQPHPIVLMHDGKASREPERQVSSNRSNTVAAVARVIRSYRAHGFRFVDLRGRSGLPPASTQLRVTRPDGVHRPVAGRTSRVVTAELTSILGPESGRRIVWEHRTTGEGRWRHGGVVRTDERGRAVVRDAPVHPTRYRLSWPGRVRLVAARGDQVTRVRPRTFGSDLRLSRLWRHSADLITVTGGLLSRGTPRGTTPIDVAVRSADGGVLHATVATTGHDGTFSVVLPASASAVSLRLRVDEVVPYRSVTVHVPIPATEEPVPPT
jgi:hypothetical protein